MSPIRTHRFTLHRTIVLSSAILLGAVCVLGYVIFQARFLIEGPLVSLVPEPTIVQHERQITIEGIAKNITSITLNGRAIVTNEEGVFRESLILENGYTIVRIDAHDRFGRAVSIEQPFVYVEPAPSITLNH